MNRKNKAISRHGPAEASPLGAKVVAALPAKFGLQDSEWSNGQWRALLETLVKSGMASWRDVTALVLGHLNPSQVGTSLASSKGFKKRYGKGNTMKIVMGWVYKQTGRCVDCRSRLELQADHVKGREEFIAEGKNALEADFIENIVLRCRRCNVIRRPSHQFGGLTYLTAESALMWILFVIRPRTLCDYKRMCRLYGMTMSDIRMDEAWAMAHWLSRAKPSAYRIEDDENTKYDLLLWPDSAVTRTDVGGKAPAGVKRLFEGVQGSAVLGFLTLGDNNRMKFCEQPVSFIPFSTYDLGARSPAALTVRYSPPNRESKTQQKLTPLPPRRGNLLTSEIRSSAEHFRLQDSAGKIAPRDLGRAPVYGVLIKTKIPPKRCRLEPHR